MIRHDNRHPEMFSISNLFCRRNSIVTGNQCINSIPICPLDQIHIQSISICDAVRNIAVCNSACFFQSFEENIRCIYPIDIIIANNADPFSICNFFPQNINRFSHIFHQHTVVQIHDRTVQITFYGCISNDISVTDQACESWTDSVFFPDSCKIRTFPQKCPTFHSFLSLYRKSSRAS